MVSRDKVTFYNACRNCKTLERVGIDGNTMNWQRNPRQRYLLNITPLKDILGEKQRGRKNTSDMFQRSVYDYHLNHEKRNELFIDLFFSLVLNLSI